MTTTNTTELAAVKAAEITNQPGSIKAAVLAQFADAEVMLTGLAEKYRNVAYDVATTKGMAEAKAARADIRDNGRLAVTKAETRIKAEVNDLKRVMSAEVERLVAIVKPVEDHIDGQIKAEEARKAAEKAERERAEAERKAAHMQNLSKLASYPSMIVGRSLEAMINGIEVVSAIQIGPEWEEFREQADLAKAKALEEMRAIADRERQRLENERLAAELEAQRRQLAEQAAELDRQRAALQAAQQPAVEAQPVQAAPTAPVVIDTDAMEEARGVMADTSRVHTAPLGNEPANEVETLTTGEVCEFFGLQSTSLRVEFIQSLGFSPVPRGGRASHWRKSDLRAIGRSLIAHIEARIA